jgi:hypothetical protein
MSTREATFSRFEDGFQKAGFDRSNEAERQPVAAHD